MARPSFEERQHSIRWADSHNTEMSLILALERMGYSRNESRRMAEAHRTGQTLQLGHNGGPLLDDKC